jgi:hypothetical protein
MGGDISERIKIVSIFRPAGNATLGQKRPPVQKLSRTQNLFLILRG